MAAAYPYFMGGLACIVGIVSLVALSTLGYGMLTGLTTLAAALIASRQTQQSPTQQSRIIERQIVLVESGQTKDYYKALSESKQKLLK